MEIAKSRKERREKLKRESAKKAKKKLSVEEQLKVDMEKLKHLTMLSDDEEEDLDKVEIIEPKPVLRNSQEKAKTTSN